MPAIIRSATLFAGALLVSILLALAMFTPVTLQFNWIAHVPGAAAYFCPESGRLAPPLRRSRSNQRPATVACLDADGRRVENKDVHERIVLTLTLFWTLALLPFFLLIARQIVWQPPRRYHRP